MRAEDYIILQQYKEIDFLFFLINCNERITEFEIKLKFGTELDSMKVNDAKLKILLKKLIEDQHIIEDGFKLSINPISKNFLGYYHAYMEKEYNEVNKKKKELGIHKLTGISNIVFIIISLVLTAIAIKNDKIIDSLIIKNELDNKKKDKIIDSLRMGIKMFKE